MIKVAVIGVGSMGKNHVRVYSRMKNVKIAAVCDNNEDTGREVSKLYKTKYYRDFAEMINKEDLDAVSIVVPTGAHKDVALGCIDKKIPVLIEKPLALNIAEAKEIIELSKKRKVILSVGHIERFNPGVRRLFKLVNEGKLGELLSVIVRRVGLFPPRISDVNVVSDLAVHDLDIITQLIGRMPQSLYAIGGSALVKGREDHAEILLDYGKVGCYIQANWITPVKICTLSVTGNKGHAELNYITQKLETYKSSYLSNISSGYKNFVAATGEPEKHIEKLKKEEPLKLELEDFIRSVINKSKPQVTGEDGLRAIVLAYLVNESIKTNTTVYLDKNVKF